MVAPKYVGRAPNSDASIVAKGFADAEHARLAVTPAYVDGAVAAHVAAAGLVDKTYIDGADLTRATKAAVDAADATYLPLDARGVSGGVASTDANNFIPASQLPALVTENIVGYVEASTVFLTAPQTVSSSATKTYQAASLTIEDPGYPYRPLPFAYVAGICPEPIDHLRRKGGTSKGKMVILSSTDALYGGGMALNALGLAHYAAVPTAPQNTTPSVVNGDLTLNLWLSLLSGTSYRFEPTEFRFFSYIWPAG